MAKKKKKQASSLVSEEDTTQAQNALEQYHQIAANVRSSINREQAEAALSEINNMPEGTQVALLKALSKELHQDAADVLLAINELSPIKNVRKEARRSLIRLEGSRIYPRWQPPTESPYAILPITTHLHYWKGMVTDTRAAGEVNLLLCFELEDDPGEIRAFGFLLDFWGSGVKDFFTRIVSKRGFDNLVAQMSEMNNIETKECSLAEGRRLLLEALAVNTQYGTLPHKDYRFNLSLVKQLILNAANLDENADYDVDDDFDDDYDEDEDFDEDNEDEIDLHDLSPKEVVSKFVEFWAQGDYTIAYDLLSSESPIREGLSKEQWIERRDDWEDEAEPVDLQTDFFHEREPQKSLLWLPRPFSASHSTTDKVVEIGWSIELEKTSLGDTLPELPQASAIYEETGRHWFWTSYTLVQDQDEWRIQSMTDEVTLAQDLSVAELQKRMQEHSDYITKFMEKNIPTRDNLKEKIQEYASVLGWRLLQSIYYTDALIKKQPEERSLYDQAASRMFLLLQYERCLVYLEPLVQRFTEQRAFYLRRLAEIELALRKRYFDEGLDQRAERCQERAEQALRESLAIEDSFEAHISLAELFIDMKKRLDEAEDHLLQAKALVTDTGDEAHIELHLGDIAVERKQYEEALSHFQRVAELEPDSASSWYNLAGVYRLLQNLEEAIANYQRAIELEPANEDYYMSLSLLYTHNNQPEQAIEVLEDAVNHIPDSYELNLFLATSYVTNEDYSKAELFLENLERIDPEAPFLEMLHETIDLSKRVPGIKKLGQPRPVSNIVESKPEPERSQPKPVFKFSHPKKAKKKRR